MRFRTFALLFVLMLLDCQNARAEEFTGTLQKIRNSKEIVIGYRDASIPFSYLDSDQQPIGFSMDVCLRIADAVKKELNLDALRIRLNPVNASTRIPLLANGTIDLECGSTTNNTERAKQVAFTNTQFLTASRFASRKTAKLDRIEDLKGKTVVAVGGTSNLKQILEANTTRSLGLTILQAKDHGEAWLMVENGRAAAYVMDDVLLASLIATSKDPSAYAISSDAFSKPEPYGLMLRKDDPAFKKVVDAATARIFRTEATALYTKWFEQPIPPRGINLNFPMSDALKNALAHPSDSPDPAVY